jgi:hypothetical protein
VIEAEGEAPAAPKGEFVPPAATEESPAQGAPAADNAPVEPEFAVAPAADNAPSETEIVEAPADVEMPVVDETVRSLETEPSPERDAQVRETVPNATRSEGVDEAARISEKPAAVASDDAARVSAESEGVKASEEVNGAVKSRDEVADVEIAGAVDKAVAPSAVAFEEQVFAAPGEEQAAAPLQGTESASNVTTDAVHFEISEETADTGEATRAEQERMINRIANTIAQSENSGRTTVRLRLYPPELGTLRVEVASRNGEVTARIETSTDGARQVLNANLSGLRDTLRSAGVNMRDMEVSYRDTSSQMGLSQGRDESRHGEPGRGRGTFQSEAQAQSTEEEEMQLSATGVLNLLA